MCPRRPDAIVRTSGRGDSSLGSSFVGRRFERLAAPGDRSHALLPEPDQQFAAVSGNLGRHDPRGDAGQFRKSRRLRRRGWRWRRGRRRILSLTIPRAPDLLGSRRLAEAFDLAARTPARPRSREVAAAANARRQTGRRASPSRDRLSTILCSSRRAASSHCPRAKLSSAAMRVPTASASSSQTERISNCRKRGSSGGRRSAPTASRRPSTKRRASPTRPCSSDTGRGSARRCAGSTATCRVHRRSAAKPRLEQRRRVLHVGEYPHAISHVKPARDLRDVGGGIAVARESFEFGFACFREHLAVAILVEAIDHHAVVAADLLENSGRRVAERGQRAGANMVCSARSTPRKGRRRRRILQFDDEFAISGAMHSASTARGGSARRQRAK